MEENQVLCVAYAADDNYAKYLGISMLSLFQSNKDFVEIDVFILDCGILEENKIKLQAMVEEYNRSIKFVSMKGLASELNLNMGARKISIASYARLFLASVIPEGYNKILYLDCDTIVRGSVTEFWNVELKDYYVAGVQDTVDRYFLKRIGLKAGDYYVNAGIILINLAAWRADKLLQRFLDFIRSFDGNVPHHDQGTINAVCNKKLCILSPKYNVTSNLYSFSVKTIKKIFFMDSFYSQRDVDEAKTNPVILHYTTGLVGRPWEENCTHPMKEEYIRVALASPWKQDPLLPDRRRFVVRAYATFYQHTPLFLSETVYRLCNCLTHIRK